MADDGSGRRYIDLSEELKTLYNLLYSFEAKVEVLDERVSVHQRTRPGRPSPQTGHRIIRCTVRPSQFQPFISQLRVELEVRGSYGLPRRFAKENGDRLYTTEAFLAEDLTRPNPLLVRPLDDESGLLRAVEFYVRLPTRSVVNEVKFRASLDVQGNGEFVMPLEGGFKEAEFNPNALLGRDRYGTLYENKYENLLFHMRRRQALEAG